MGFKFFGFKLSGSADLLERDDQVGEVVKEAVQRSPHFREMLRINLLSSMTEECPESHRKFMRKYYRRGVNRFLHQMFGLELPEWQRKSDS